MSTIYSKTTIIQEIATDCKCDTCGKLAGEAYPNWISVNGRHNSWGNDSYESRKDYHACSSECLLLILKEENDRLGNEIRPEIEIEIEGEMIADFIKFLESK